MAAVSMVSQYSCVALQSTLWGVERRAEIKRNIQNLEGFIGTAISSAELEAPTRLVALPEGALTGSPMRCLTGIT